MACVQVISSSGVDTDTLWFSIGSVEKFERNLETVQHELGIDPARSVPVVYKSQTELGTVLSFLPTVLLIGFLIWSMRRAGAGNCSPPPAAGPCSASCTATS